MSTNIKELANSRRMIDLLPADVDPAVATAVGFLQAVVDIVMPPLVKNSNGNKDISEFYPFMKDHFIDMKPFAKVELLASTGTIAENDEVRQLKLSDIDRYMLNRMQYQVGADIAAIECDEGGIPKSLKGNDKIVAKAILRRSLTNEETGILKSLKNECLEALKKYHGYEIYVGMLKENKYPSDKKYFYQQITEARQTGWFADMPDPDAEELKYVEETKKKEEEEAEKITLENIEAIVDAGIENAAFDFHKVLDVLKGTTSTKGIIINGIIEMIGGIVKTFVVSNSDKVRESFDSCPKISVDKSVEKIEGLAELLKEIIIRMGNLKGAGIDGQAKTIDDIVSLIKENKEVFESEAFIDIIEKALAKREAKKNKADEVKPVKPENNVEKLDEAKAEEQAPVENAAMAMTANEAFPQLHKDEQDSDKPGFLDGLVAMIKPAKEKPGFIQETNAIPVKETTAVQTSPVEVAMAVNTDVLRDYPWIQRIVECARKRAVSLRIDPVMNIAPNTVGAITVLAYKDNQSIPSKSFTIDLGHCLDSRIKVFANCKASGFAYMETCSEAYKIFTDNGKDVLVEFFDKLFLFGFDGFNDEESKKYRMYNSNTMQLNRLIHFNSLPTGQVEKGEKRQALKDSAFKMMTQLKEIGRINGIEVGRFIVTDFDRENMSYVLDNAGSMYNGRFIAAPHMRIRVTITMEDGKVVRDEHKRPCLSYSIEFVDNVIENFKYPDGSVLVVNAENATEEIQQTEPDEVLEGEVIDEIKPSFVQ